MEEQVGRVVQLEREKKEEERAKKKAEDEAKDLKIENSLLAHEKQLLELARAGDKEAVEKAKHSIQEQCQP